MQAYYCRRAGEAWSERYSVAPRQGRRAFALPEATAPYAPDRPYDAVHISLAISLDLEQQCLEGTCATTVRAVQEGLRELTLDAVGLQIKQVYQAGGTVLPYDYDGSKLRITLAEPLARDVARTVEADHSVTNLMTLLVGEFSAHNALVDGIPVQWYVERGREADGQRAFGDTPAMLRFLSQQLGVPYPWHKYAQIAVGDFMFGGMEHTSATTQTDLTLHDRRAHVDFSSNGLVAHALAHQWFGNLVTCKSWAHAWLNEGFATYFDALLHGPSQGVSERRQTAEVQQLREDFQSLRDANQKLVERLERLEARQPDNTPTAASAP